jgi:phage baseplate assembly protein gpV
VNTAVSQLSEYPPDEARARYYGKYRGIVSAVDAATCRIKAKVPAVLGSADSGWCLACVPYAGPQVGIAFLPEIGSGVWIEFEGGDVSYPVWAGCYWRDGEPPSDAAAHVKVIVTTAPHKLILDDDQGTITISDPNGNTVTLGPDGITLSNGAQQVVVSTASVSINDGALEVQ